MYRLALFIALWTLPALAADKPNTLTPKEIADGWVMLFDGETTFGWKVEGDVTVKDGMLVLKGGDKPASITSHATFGSFDLRLEIPKGSGPGEFILDTGKGRSSSGLPGQATHFTAAVAVGKKAGTSVVTESQLAADGLQKSHVVAGCERPNVVRIATVTRDPLIIHSVALRPKDTTPLFNGKDLSGWKVYPGAKDKKVTSKYTVTTEGWLNVKDGPGDIQTEGQWADFIVQLDCISNGKHLNSGLFFRCLPDQYQQGYEAQVRNEWMGDDRTKPVDFGTGAIYRRQPARKVVSTDGEWFTMTVAAHDRHIATWVNGYPVVAWTDDREEKENARQGFKKGKGALSIQGHDPTTDLSFRNIRIQSLDAK